MKNTWTLDEDRQATLLFLRYFGFHVLRPEEKDGFFKANIFEAQQKKYLYHTTEKNEESQ